MRILIVEDDFVSRKLLKRILETCAECDIAVDGEEAVHAFRLAWEEGDPYDLICMDIMMPNLDGQQALARIREMEKETGRSGRNEVKVIMTTAADDPKNIFSAFYIGGATSYLVKPVDRRKLLDEIGKMGFDLSGR